MGHIIRRTEYLNCGALVQEVSQGKYFSMLPKDDSCAILVNNGTIFCVCPKSLSEAKEKSFGIITLAENISKQSSINSLV